MVIFQTRKCKNGLYVLFKVGTKWNGALNENILDNTSLKEI